jgi:hypothetical protein
LTKRCISSIDVGSGTQRAADVGLEEQLERRRRRPKIDDDQSAAAGGLLRNAARLGSGPTGVVDAGDSR